MFKLVVLFAIVAVAAARPGLLHGIGIPAAVSHTSRVDVHHAVPHVAHVALAAPAIHVAPAVVAHHVPAAVSHQARVDVIHSSPIVHSVPVVHAGLGLHGLHGLHGVHGVHGLHHW